MKFTTAIAFFAAVLPAVCLPTARQFNLPTCGAETCLTDGVFDACAPGDLACLCTLEQSEVTRYVETVQSCLDGEAGQAACTAGAIYQYKDLLKTVCATEQFGNKTVVFTAPIPSNATTTNTTIY
ncbi:hypothetical protein P153DRAFT_390694 [Dothidotthia symphoricarpi CBS 119687]|uniref:Uncharacterized protein n=1 Tax=Dothidotthia symphoricarpi CBS 119687 TaxID=1392245 RepID=A0A6A5ZZ22_9PLEO|nr:uncharacterized protein P153DRAFT_390694 [Dothidotthia symphoricarpi CBS 119687]KAF2124144.1 hypothetical protein P153DRAFT_390694 [Dothidotthia symphoricarpi CBS 119687]